MKTPTFNIVAGIDFSEFSAYALDHAVGISKYIQTQIHLVYVIENTGGIVEVMEGIEKQVHHWFTTKLEQLKNKYRWDLKDYHIHILKGKPHEEISKLARQLNARFIFMGANNSTDKNKLYTGSNVLRVISKAICPVVILKEKDNHKTFHHILLPVELHGDSNYPSVEYTIDFLKNFPEMTVKTVSVLNHKEDIEVNKAALQIAQIKNRVEQSGYKCSAEIVKNNKSDDKISDILMDYAKKCEADVVFLYHHRSHELKEYFMGAVGLDITNRINIPVIIIND